MVMGLRRKLWICGFFAIVFAIFLVLICVRYRQIVIEKSIADAEQKLESNAIHIEMLIREIETIAVNVKDQIMERIDNPRSLSDYYEQVLLNNRKLRGIGVGYERGFIEGHDICLLYAMSNKNGEVFSNFYEEDNYCEFYSMDWYSTPKSLGAGIWIDPYESQINKTQVLTYSTPLYDESGKFIGVMALDLHVADITDFLHHEELNFYRLLIGCDGELIYTSSGDKMPVKTMMEMAILESDKRIMEHCKEIIGGRSGQGNVRWLEEESYLLYKGLSNLEWTVGVVLPMGYMYAGVEFVMVMQLLALVVFVLFVMMAFMFLHSLRKQNLELNEARSRAERADKMKSQFLANMSHEIRTPLNAIVGFAELLACEGENITEQERRDFVNIIFKNNELLLTIVNDILDLSKIESGSYELVLDDVDINAVCRFVEASMKGRVPKNVVLCFEQTMPDVVLRGDSGRIEQVLMQFVGNACKHIKNGEIVIGCEDLGDSVKVSVKDTGEGIKEKDIPFVFDRFYKGDSKVQGIGLGLPICQKLVALWHGKIGVQSEYGEGSVFWFTINK